MLTEITGRAHCAALQTSGDIRAAAERNHNGVGCKGKFDDFRDLFFRARIDNQIWKLSHVAAPNPHQVAQALSVRMHNAVEWIVFHILGAQRRLQAGTQFRRRQGRRD